jgi:hypothetical protein
MAGYLMAVNYTDSNTLLAHTVLWGVGDGEFPDQISAITNTTSVVVAYKTSRGENPTGVVTLVSATR